MKLTEIFQSGILTWIQILVALGVLVIFLVKLADLFIRKDLPDARKKAGIHTVLFLGSFNAVFGLLIQVLGMVQALNAIIEAADISPQLVIDGLRRSFMNPILGVSTLLAAGIFWFILQARCRNLAARAGGQSL